jgi:hypothetical protein
MDEPRAPRSTSQIGRRELIGFLTLAAVAGFFILVAVVLGGGVDDG